MTKSERENWIINIENTAANVRDQVGQVVVDSVLQRYGARDIQYLNSRYLPDVFSELCAIEVDTK